MRQFYDTTSKRYLTDAMVLARGFTLENTDALARVGIIPVVIERPEYDGYTHQALPDGDPQPSEEDAGVYVQKFVVQQYTDRALTVRLKKISSTKKKDVLTAADAAVNQYMSMFSDVERATWPTQQKEVHAYLDDPFAPTPTLDGLAAARGIERDLMLQKAIVKVQAFEPLSVAIVGRQQKYEDLISNTAADESKSLVDRINEIRALEFDFSDIMAAVSGA